MTRRAYSTRSAKPTIVRGQPLRLFKDVVKLVLMTEKRYWTSYWRAKYWSLNEEGAPLSSSGGSFTKRRISQGDALYVVSLRGGQLLVGGRMIVDKVVSREEAMRIRKTSDLYPAGEWVIAKDGSGTLLHHNRELSDDISKLLRFASGRPTLMFVNNQDLDGQTLRTVRELTKESARLLDEIIQFTDRRRPPAPIRITLDELERYRAQR